MLLKLSTLTAMIAVQVFYFTSWVRCYPAFGTSMYKCTSAANWKAWKTLTTIAVVTTLCIPSSIFTSWTTWKCTHHCIFLTENTNWSKILTDNKNPAVSERANHTAYDALINDHLNNNTSCVRIINNKMVTWSRKTDRINKYNFLIWGAGSR